MDRDHGLNVRSGRIILLGDGTEVIPDQSEEELFEEDRDLASQIQREPSDAIRNEREGTPGPQLRDDQHPTANNTSSTAMDQSGSTADKPSS